MTSDLRKKCGLYFIASKFFFWIFREIRQLARDNQGDGEFILAIRQLTLLVVGEQYTLSYVVSHDTQDIDS